ncbi:MAG: hypothetical protein HKN20_00020 [Gemmatimonadetes bacterium]|nr:hypothetical protein [Gemmatimonadota bacterium]
MNLLFRQPISVFCIALALRALVVFGFLRDMPFVSDAANYAAMAIGFLTAFPGEIAFFWPPGTALILLPWHMLFGDSPIVAQCVVLVFSSLAAALTVTVARAVLGRESDLTWVGIAACFYPASLLMAGQTYSQHFIAVPMLLIAIVLIRYLNSPKATTALLLGLLLGVAVLVRPSALSVTAALVPFLVWWNVSPRNGASRNGAIPGAVRDVVLLLLPVALLATPVLLHNQKHDAGFSLSTNNEWNLFVGNNRYTPDYKTSHFGQRAPEDLPREIRKYLRAQKGSLDREDRERLKSTTIEFMKENPVRTIVRTWNRVKAFWGADYIMSRQIQNHFDLGSRGVIPLLVFEAGGYLLIACLALVGFFHARSEIARAGLFALPLLALAYQAPYSIAFSAGTYHYPVFFLLFPFAAVGFGEALRRRKPIPLTGKRLLACLVLLALFAALQIEYVWHTIKAT